MSTYTLEETEPAIRVLANGLEFPEGPVALPDGSVVLVEIANGWLTRVAADGSRQQWVHLGAGPNGAAMGPGGRLFICNNGGFEWHRSAGHGLRPIGQARDYAGGRIEAVDLASGRVECLYTQSDSGPLKGPNDLVFDRHGGFWFTDHGKVRPREVDRGSVCYALADGSAIREAVFPLWSPNGIGLSPDEKTLYVAETFTGRLWAFDIGGPGQILARPWPDSPNGGRLVCRLPGMQNIDSLAVDAEGNICLATLGEGGITVVSPAGQVLHRVELPDPMTTNLCFGGADLKTAFVTLSSSGRLAALDWPCPGWPLNFLDR